MIATHRRMLGLLAGALSILIAACGSPGPLTLSLAPSQASSGINRAVEATVDTSKDSLYSELTYEPVADLSTDRVSGFAWSVFQKNDTKDAFSAIAVALGVAGAVVKQDENSFTIGVPPRTDSTTPATEPQMYLWVNTTGAWWSYFSPVSGMSSVAPCAPDDKECAIAAPPAPTDLLSERDALNRTISTLTSGGYNTATYDFTATSTGWSTEVLGVLNIAGIPTNMTVSFSYGDKGTLLSASGPLVYVKRANGYYMVSPKDAVERLQDPRYTAWGNATDIAVKEATSSPDSDASSSDPRVIPITGVRYVLMQARLTSKASILLPAYTFSNDDGDVGTVIAIEDKYLSFGDDPVTDGSAPPTPEPQPIPEPTETSPPGTGGGSPGMSPITEMDAQKLVGLTEEEAAKVAQGNGWTVRVAMRDGEGFMLTTDYQDNRVNLTITEGLVTAVTVG